MSRYFLSVESASGSEDLYSTDGTAAGTVNLEIASLNPDFFLGSNLFDVAGRALFLGIDGNTTGSDVADLYTTDGTPGGTTKQLYVGSNYDYIGAWTVGSTLIISGTTPTTDTPVMYASTDGVNFIQIANGVGTSDLVVSHGIGYFAAPSPDNKLALWRTDGTGVGTLALAPAGSLAPIDLAQVANGRTVFISKTDLYGGTLWVTDGTPGGTQEISANLGLIPQWGYGIATTGNRAVFTATNAAGNISAWGTDGTTAGTQELVANEPTSTKLEPDLAVQLGNKVVFDGGDGLFATDGTTAGTIQLIAGYVDDRAVVGNKLYFFDPQTSQALFVTDGTAAGTHTVQLPGSPSPPPYNTTLFAVGNELIYEGTDATGQAALYQTDGTVAGTSELSVGGAFDPSSLSYAAALPSGSSPGSGVVTLPGGAQYYVAAAGTTVQPGSGSDTIAASAGAVTVLGGPGKLTFKGGSSPSSVSGGSGSDTIFGGTGGGNYTGGSSGGDVLVSQGASAGNTTLTGAGAADRIFGSPSGTDVLNIGAGRETVVSGGGIVTVNGGSAASVVFTGTGTSSVNGGAGGSDTVVAGRGTTSVFAQNGDAVFGSAGTLLVSGSAARADSIVGGSGPLIVAGKSGNMLVVASTTTSTLNVGNGASLIYTSSGSSTVHGGTGALGLVVGSGANTINEGSGAAIFDVVRGAAGGADVVTGFRPGTDQVQLYGYSAAEQQISISAGSTIISLSDGTKVTLVGVTNAGGSIVG